MSIKCGFFNSINKDRLYSAENMNEPYKGLISNGVLVPNADATENEKLNNKSLKVSYSGSGMNITVGAGRGIFSDKWFLNDSDMILTVSDNNMITPRIDSVIVRIDNRVSGRKAEILILQGTPSNRPIPPQINAITNVVEYRLANIMVRPSITTLSNSAITDTRGSSECGWCAGLLKQIDTSELFTQFQTGFDEWFNNVKETLATSTLIRSYNSYYTTSVQDETVIPIQISQYNRNLDILQVYINGLMLIKDLEYTINSNSQITLTDPVDPQTPVSFVVYKSIDGTDAETVVSQVNDLQNLYDKTKITNNTGGAKLSVTDTNANVLTVFVNAGVGFHTLYAANGVQGLPATGAFRLFGHLTNASYGYLFAMQANGSVFSNYLNEGQWRGWRVVHEVAPEALWVSASGQGTFPNADVEVVPSKPLSQCQHGWQLIWSGYDDAGKVGKDYYVQTVFIPKRSYKNLTWNGESTTFSLVYSYNQSNDINLQCTKTFTIYDTRIISSSFNSQGVSRNMVLRAIYEY